MVFFLLIMERYKLKVLYFELVSLLNKRNMQEINDYDYKLCLKIQLRLWNSSPLIVVVRSFCSKDPAQWLS